MSNLSDPHPETAIIGPVQAVAGASFTPKSLKLPYFSDLDLGMTLRYGIALNGFRTAHMFFQLPPKGKGLA